MEEAHLLNHVRHLQEVEGLSIRQVADVLGLGRKKTTRLIEQGGIVRKKRKSLLADYARLIEDWYEAYPSLKASQIYDRLQAGDRLQQPVSGLCWPLRFLPSRLHALSG